MLDRKYKREIENLKTDIQFLEAVIEGAKEREERLRHIATLARYQQERAQKRLNEALAVLKNGGELCELCANMADDACGGKCPACTLPCPCRFCENGSGFAFKEEKKCD